MLYLFYRLEAMQQLDSGLSTRRYGLSRKALQQPCAVLLLHSAASQTRNCDSFQMEGGGTLKGTSQERNNSGVKSRTSPEPPTTFIPREYARRNQRCNLKVCNARATYPSAKRRRPGTAEGGRLMSKLQLCSYVCGLACWCLAFGRQQVL